MDVAKLKDVIGLLRWYTIAVPVNAVASAFILAGDFNIVRIALASLSVCLVLFFTNALNFLYDVEEDKLHPMTHGENAYARGALTRREMWGLVALYFLGSLATAFPVAPGWALAILLGDVIGFSYSVWPLRMKGKRYGWFITGNASIPLAFLCAYATASASYSFPPVILVAAAFIYFTMTLHLVKDVPDMEADKSVGDRTFPIAHGIGATRNIIVLSALLTLLAFVALVGLGVVSLVGLPFYAAIIAWVLKLVWTPLERLKDRMFVYMNLMLKANGTTIPLIFLASVIARKLVSF